MHTQYDGPRGADTKGEDRFAVSRNGAASVWWLGYHPLGYKTNDRTIYLITQPLIIPVKMPPPKAPLPDETFHILSLIEGKSPASVDPALSVSRIVRLNEPVKRVG